MKHLATAVRPGAVRIETQGQWSAFSLAFRNPDRSITIVCHNPFDMPQSVCVHDGTEQRLIEMPPHSFHTLKVSVLNTEH